MINHPIAAFNSATRCFSLLSPQALVNKFDTTSQHEIDLLRDDELHRCYTSFSKFDVIYCLFSSYVLHNHSKVRKSPIGSRTLSINTCSVNISTSGSTISPWTHKCSQFLPFFKTLYSLKVIYPKRSTSCCSCGYNFTAEIKFLASFSAKSNTSVVSLTKRH